MIERFGSWLIGVVSRPPPDFVIGGAASPYLRRWWVIPRNPYFNIYLHQILRDDDDRALHNHPWINCSILLRGEYYEVTARQPTGIRRVPGEFIFRWGASGHRLFLPAWSKECWSLFITGPVMREWGFYCPQGWRPWREFVAPDDTGSIGRGCE